MKNTTNLSDGEKTNLSIEYIKHRMNMQAQRDINAFKQPELINEAELKEKFKKEMISNFIGSPDTIFDWFKPYLSVSNEELIKENEELKKDITGLKDINESQGMRLKMCFETDIEELKAENKRLKRNCTRAQDVAEDLEKRLFEASKANAKQMGINTNLQISLSAEIAKKERLKIVGSDLTARLAECEKDKPDVRPFFDWLKQSGYKSICKNSAYLYTNGIDFKTFDELCKIYECLPSANPPQK